MNGVIQQKKSTHETAVCVEAVLLTLTTVDTWAHAPVRRANVMILLENIIELKVEVVINARCLDQVCLSFVEKMSTLYTVRRKRGISQ